jgi:hypothetical protein
MSVLSAGPAQGNTISKVINTTIDGTNIEGQVTGSSFDITVIITKPYVSLSQGSHIMIQVRGLRSFDGEYGEFRALETLENLYRVGCHLQQHEDALRANVRPFQRRISDLKGTEKFELKAWQIKEEFFDAYLPDYVSLSLRESVWEMLDGRKSLR